MNRRTWLTSSLGGMASLSLAPPSLLQAQEAEYSSPYRLQFRHERRELEEGFHRHPWNAPGEQSAVPQREWYDKSVERRWGAWGPTARQYPAAPELHRRSVTWLQDRVILTASRWIGLPYQHHHIPDWDPPKHWPWLKVAYGRNSRGIDCSNFSSFYYNYGLGIKLDTGIKQQGERLRVRGPGGRGVVKMERIERQPYDELIRTLEPADLLFIKNNAGHIAHVILWLGEVGVSPDGSPLVIDSTGGGHRDSDGNLIPIGVHIRPFTKSSWYAADFSHAHRIVRSLGAMSDGEVEEAEEGGAYEP